MAKRKHNLSSTKPFEKHFHEFLCNGYNVGNVFEDFLELTLLALLNNNYYSDLDSEKKEDRESKYLRIIDKYCAKNLSKLFPMMFADLIEIMEIGAEPYGSDYLGYFFEQNITFGEHGQFFTPHSISDLLSKMSGPIVDGSLVNDPACGSGRTLLSALEENRNIVVIGNDLDRRCVQMATLNLFLRGAKGEVHRMNSLSQERYGGYKFGLRGGMIPWMVET